MLVYHANNAAESSHIWTMGILDSLLPSHEFWTWVCAPWWGLMSTSWTLLKSVFHKPVLEQTFTDTVKILEFGTPQTIAIIVLKIEMFDVTLH